MTPVIFARSALECGDLAPLFDEAPPRLEASITHYGKPLEFFCQPVKFDCPITAESWAAICCPPSTASAQVGKSSRSPLHRAAAYPLHPLHPLH